MGGRSSFFRKSTGKNLASNQRSLSKKLSYIDDGVRRFIPKNAIIDHIKPIAGKDGKTKLRIAKSLADSYGGNSEDWNKYVGQVKSDKYTFDVHWFEINGNSMYLPKIKDYRRRKR